MKSAITEATLRPASSGTSRASLIATVAYAVITIGAIVIFFASFIALLIGGGGGRHALFALVIGSVAFATLAMVQFIQWAVVLLRILKGRP